MTVNFPIHRLLLHDNRPNSPVVLDLASAMGGPALNGYGLWGDPNGNTAIPIVFPAPDQLQTDPAGLNRDGQEPRGSRLDNRTVEFPLRIKGSTRSDAMAKLGALEEMANKCREAMYTSGLPRPSLLWQEGKTGRAKIAECLHITVSPPPNYVATLRNNVIGPVNVRIIARPNFKGYQRPAFVPVLNTNGGQRTDAYATEGYKLASNDYLISRWHPWLTSAATGAILLWFRAEWLSSDTTKRYLLSWKTSSTETLAIYKGTDGSYNVAVNGGGGGLLTIPNPSTTQFAWYGIATEWGTNGFNAWFLPDGVTSSTDSVTATAFSGNTTSLTFAPTALPDEIRVGDSAAAAFPSNAEIDSVILAQRSGFEVPTDVALLPYTRDAGSILTQTTRSLLQRIDPNTSSVTTSGDLHVAYRHVPGNRPGDLSVRVTPVTTNLSILRFVTTAHRQDSAGNNVVFSNAADAATDPNVTVGSGWAAASHANAMGGGTTNVISRSTSTGGMEAFVTGTDYAYKKTVTIPAYRETNAFPAGSYLVLLRVYGNTVADLRYRVDLVLSPQRLSSGIVELTAATATDYRLVPMGIFTLPLAGVRPGGSFTFDYEVYAQNVSGTTRVDGVFFWPLSELSPGIHLAFSSVLTSSQAIEAYTALRPDVFRVNPTTGVDLARSFQQSYRFPTLQGTRDCRLYALVEQDTGTAGDYPNHVRDSQVLVDACYVPADRLPR